MTGRVFVDTNVMICAPDLDAGPRHEQAASAISDLREKESGILSVQVLREFYVKVNSKDSRADYPLIGTGYHPELSRMACGTQRCDGCAPGIGN